MANFNAAPSDKKSGSGMPFKLLVRICGLAGVGAFFLPFFEGMSGLEYFKAIFGVIGEGGIKGLFDTFGEGGPAIIGGIFLILGYIIFPIISLWMLLSGKYSGGPLTFVLLFNLAGWLIIHFWGTQMGVETSFFGIVGLGYWIATAALFVPFVGMFFLDKSI